MAPALPGTTELGSGQAGEIVLVPLRCVSCHARLGAGEFQTAFLCGHCGAGQALEGERLVPQEITFAEGKGEMFLPFWALDARVRLTTQLLDEEIKPVQFSQALAQDPELIRNVILSYHQRMADMRVGETREMILYIPGFEATNFANYTANLGVVFTSAQPEIKPGKPGPMVPAVYERRDAENLAEVILVAVEAGRHPEVVDLGFEIEIQRARLLGIPFYKDGDCFRDGLLGARILAVGVVGLEGESGKKEETR